MKRFLTKIISKVLFWIYLHIPSLVHIRKIIVFLIVRLENGYMYSDTIRKIFKLKNIEIGYGSYGGCFSSSIPNNVSFGNYCSVAQNIRIFRAYHPKDLFTSHPILYNPVVNYVKKDRLTRPHLAIGHDVWIGEWSIILPNVTSIGNGAIIGAGSVVTKNVDPYNIVAGNPAKVIGKRFNEDIIQRIEKTRWWNLKVDELIERIHEFENITNSEI